MKNEKKGNHATLFFVRIVRGLFGPWTARVSGTAETE